VFAIKLTLACAKTMTSLVQMIQTAILETKFAFSISVCKKNALRILSVAYKNTVIKALQTSALSPAIVLMPLLPQRSRQIAQTKQLNIVSATMRTSACAKTMNTIVILIQTAIMEIKSALTIVVCLTRVKLDAPKTQSASSWNTATLNKELLAIVKILVLVLTMVIQVLKVAWAILFVTATIKTYVTVRTITTSAKLI
jgi:hypothetical protein